MHEVQVRVTQNFATFTVHGVRLKKEDPNIAIMATLAHSSTLQINRILTKSIRPSVHVASPAAVLVAVPVVRARSALPERHPLP